MIWATIRQSRIVRWIGAAFMGTLAVLTFGAVKRREGVQAERARDAVRDAKETIKAHEVRDEVEDDVARGGDARARLRSEWRE
jgi:hypothetical protein